MPTDKVSTPYYFVDVVAGIVDVFFWNLVGEKLITALWTLAEAPYRLAHTIRTLEVRNITATRTIHDKKKWNASGET